MTNKENHQENVRLAKDVFYHGRFFHEGVVQPNKNKKRDEFLVKRRGVVYEAKIMYGLPTK